MSGPSTCRPGRVIHITEAWGGGVARAICDYTHNHDGTSLVLARARRGFQVRDVSPAVELHSSQHRIIWAWMALRFLWAKGQPNDIFFLHSSLAGLLRLFVPRRSQKKIVYMPHGFAFQNRRSLPHRASLCVERLLRNRCSLIGVVGVGERSQAIDVVGFEPDRTQLIPHALPPADPNARLVEVRSRQIVAVGRICWQKGADRAAALPAKFRRICAKNYDFLWIGDGDPVLRQGLLDGGWSVKPWMSQQQLWDEVSAAELLVHPARYEGLPLTVLEAMRVGTPVVAYDILGVQGIQNVVVCQSAEEVVQELTALADSRDRRNRVGEASRVEVATKFTDSLQRDALGRVLAQLSAS